jgi:CubicO group peptidase (beta-lactamase class C family)
MSTVAASSVGIPDRTIDSLQRAAVALQSDAFLIVRDGRVVHEWTSPGFAMPFNPQSITKAITGLGVGVLLDRGVWTGLDVPVGRYFPEFTSGPKQAITLRHLMTHTSGLAAGRGEAQFYERGRGDAGAFVRGQPLSEPVGTTFRYSNVGAQLVSHVVQAAAGAPLHAVLDSAVFAPLCMRDWRWALDDRGATYGYSRLELTARDLAKIGQLVLDGGVWNGRRVLRADVIDTLTMWQGGMVPDLASSGYVGLWQYLGADSVRLDGTLVERLRSIPVSDSLVAVVAGVIGDGPRVMETPAFRARLDSTFGAGAGVRRWYAETQGRVMPRRWRGPAQAIVHSGSWGQYLLIFPETRTVVVRFAAWNHPGRRDENDASSWPGIVGDTYRLLGRRVP